MAGQISPALARCSGWPDADRQTNYWAEWTHVSCGRMPSVLHLLWQSALPWLQQTHLQNFFLLFFSVLGFFRPKHPTIFTDCIFTAAVNLSLGTVHPCTLRDAAPTPTLVHWGSGCQSIFKGKSHSHQPTMTGLLLALLLLLPSFQRQSVCFCSLSQSNQDTHFSADCPYSQYASTCSVMWLPLAKFKVS